MFEVDARKAIRFVLVFLPGFISLWLTDSIVGLSMTEIEFVYVAIFLSVVSHWFLDVVRRGLRNSIGGVGESKLATTIGAGAYVVIIVVMAIGTGMMVQNDWLTRAVNWTSGEQFNKLSNDNVFSYLLKHHQNCTLFEVSRRVPHYQGEKKVNQERKKVAPPESHKPWVIVNGAGTETYEGNVRFFSSGGGERSKIYLAPACRVVNSDGAEVRQPVEGNGVLIADVRRLEFVDVRRSQCAEMFGITEGGRKCD